MADTMTLRQLAAYLQMSVDSVYHLVRRGKIPGVKIGKQWRFSKAAIDRWLASTTTKTARVLVVMTDDATCGMVLTALHAKGHQPVGVSTIEETHALTKQIAFDIAIVDLSLADNGFSSIIEHLQKLPQPPEILVISGYENDAALQRVKELMPYVTVLHKPLDLNAVVELVLARTGGK